jgi:hypothetical protein
MCAMSENAECDLAIELIGLCRAGRLYEISHWIAEGRSLSISAAKRRGTKKGLLEIAVETGFHSLVELLVKNESAQTAKDAALDLAVSLRRLDLIEVLCANGADPRSVPLADVLRTSRPELLRFFLDHGADPLNGKPFAEALGAKLRTALRAFVDYKQAHPEHATQLQEQIDCALRHFCGEGDLKWVSLLIWAGADPRSSGPVLNEECIEDPEYFTSGLEQACHPESIDVMKKLKPDSNRDNLANLLHCAARWSRTEILEYLLRIGAIPNDKANGGSSALGAVLRGLGFFRIGSPGPDRLSSRYDVRRTFDCVSALVSHGAVWRPDSGYELVSLRRALIGCEPMVLTDLLEIFRKHNVCSTEAVQNLLGTPQMRKHLTSETNALLRLGIHLEMNPISIRWNRTRQSKARD